MTKLRLQGSESNKVQGRGTMNYIIGLSARNISNPQQTKSQIQLFPFPDTGARCFLSATLQD